MNNPHYGARLTVRSREQIVARVLAGQSAAEVAAALTVSVRTERKWLDRFYAGGQVLGDPPVDLPPLEQRVQWHTMRSHDPALDWLRQLLHTTATKQAEAEACGSR